jgi:hypothetical protein
MTIKPNTWQSSILAKFQPKRESMLVVIDPDNLLQNEALLAEIQNSSYDILQLEDEVTFRNRFERNYRSRWDNGEPRHVVVIVHTTESLRHIPFDLLQKGKRIEVSVSALFPHLNALTLCQLDHAYYDDIYTAHEHLAGRNESLHSERATLELILRAGFGLDPAVKIDPARLVELLIHKHYLARNIPPALEAYLVQHIFPKVSSYELKAEFLDLAADFYAWLSFQWKEFIKARTADQIPQNPFLDDVRLRPLIANLFAEGLIPRIPAPTKLKIKDWVAVGLLPSSGKMNVGEWSNADLYALKARLARFANLNESNLPQGKTDLRDWLNLAAEWAEAVYQANSLPGELYKEVARDLAIARSNFDKHFNAFVQARYSAVDHYQDSRGPISVAKVNSWLSQVAGEKERVALICFDGLALDQWHLLREYIQSKIPNLTISENRAYAMAPTITPISRQSLFAGRPPVVFEETWDKTTQDADRWHAYWVHLEIPAQRVNHIALKSSAPDFTALQAILDNKNVRLGILINLFDDVMHASKELPPESDKRIYYDTLRSYLENGALDKLFTILLENSYRIFVTSDHGNIAGIGNGLTPPRALIETYARRVAIFDQESLAQEFAEKNAEIYYRTKSLPPSLHPVYLPGNQLFATLGSAQISHGSLSIEELVVPFVEITRA